VAVSAASTAAATGIAGRALDSQGFDASSVASESGVHGLNSVPSVSVLGAEDSTCGEPVHLSEETQRLREYSQWQEKRIESLESMHQQTLRDLRRSRDEVKAEQEKRFREADKLLGMQQLLSEMQIIRFDGDPQMQHRWEELLQRSRSILEAD